VARASVERGSNYIDICGRLRGGGILFSSRSRGCGRRGHYGAYSAWVGSRHNNVIVKWFADHLDRVDEIHLFWVVSIAELAARRGDHSLHMITGKIPNLDGTSIRGSRLR